MDRSFPTSASPPGSVTGGSMVDKYAEAFGVLYNNIILRPLTIVNSGNDYTITVDPVLDADVVEGMSFTVIPNVNSVAGGVRLRVTSGNPYYPVVLADGSALGADEFKSDTLYWLYFYDGEFRILSRVNVASGGGAASAHFEEFLSSGTWTKPADIDPDAWILVELWGGGGGGGASSGEGGGGGGAYAWKLFKASDLPNSVFVSIGAGGAVETAGGVTTFDTYLSAYGGGRTTGVNGAGGGGATSAGDNAAANPGGGGGPNFPEGLIAAGGSPDAGFWENNYGAVGGDTGVEGGSAIYGGGGGGGNNGIGGKSVYGGGGGGGGKAAGGTSIYGGNGGNGGSSVGAVPGGGGGRGFAGGAGRAWIRVVG